MQSDHRTKHRCSRRRFLTAVGTAGAAQVVPMFVPASALGREGSTAPSERITIGMIGVGRQARAYNLPWFLKSPETEVVAVCDVDAWRLNRAVETVQQSAGVTSGSVVAYRDFRELLDNDTIDAVMISTPDHWHVPMSIAAVRHGKDVCCEKPITKSIAEGRRLSTEVTRHNRIFRVDSEARTRPSFFQACEVVRNGRIGKLVEIEVGTPPDNVGCGQPEAMTIPKELDYDMWLGPAASVPYTVQRVHPHHDYGRGGWMRIRDYDDGMITNWGAHLIDIALWGADLERTGPIHISGTGTFPENELWDVMQHFHIDYTYATGLTMTVRSIPAGQTPDHYTRFIGNNGWVEAGFNHVTASDPEILSTPLDEVGIRLVRKDEKQDFVDCVRSRQQPLADAEVGHRTNSIGLLGIIAAETGQKLTWDPAKEEFLHDPTANQFLERPVRAPWNQF